jgi:hypothetical protein
MNPQLLVASLVSGRETLRAMTANLGPEQILWRPAAGKWSILEVICHLADEERDDFRTRLDLTLHQPCTVWPSIDPQGWVESRDYQNREFAAALDDLMQERENSLVWLRSLEAPRWDNSYEHPRLGTVRAGDILASWAAHDLLHIRQIVSLQFGCVAAQAAPYTPDYAGPW